MIVFLAVVAAQIGITLLLWAMCRLLKATPSFMALFSVVGYSFLPYGALAVLIIYFNTMTFSTIVLGILAFIAFLWLAHMLARIIHVMDGFSLKKAYLCIVLCMIFFGSFIHVFGY